MDTMKRSFALHGVLSVVGLLFLFFTLLYGSAGWFVFFLCCLLIVGFEYVFCFRGNGIFNPYLFMILSPLLLINYASIGDFNIRAVCFIFFIYIFNIAYSHRNKQTFFGGPGGGFSKKPPGRRRQLLKVWLTAFLIFSFVSTVLYVQGIHLSGDEPHYVMIAQSLVEDGDFDLKNNFEEKSYLEYIPVEVRFHGGEIKGRHLSFHMPGVSFLLVPFFLLFKLVGGFIPAALYFRLAASVINAFFALALYYVLRNTFPGKNITGMWLLFLGIFPLVFHSVHLYPELPAAALMIAAYLTAASPRRNIVVMGLFLSLVPWFHVKYIPPLLVLTVYILYDLLKPFKPFHVNKEKVKRLGLFFLFPVISLAVLVIYSKLLYNTYSPTDIFPKESYLTVPWLLRLKVFLAYFLDQRDGLLFYSPLFFLAFLGLRKKMNHLGLLLGIGLSYVFFHAFTTVRGAFSPAGRPLVFIGWVLIIFIAHFYYEIIQGVVSRFTFKALAGLSLFVTAWLFYYPLFMYQPVFSHTLERASGIDLFFSSNTLPLWKFFPSFLTSPESGHPANFVWLGLLAAVLVFYYIRPLRRVEKPLKPLRLKVLTVVLFLVFSFLYCFFPHVMLTPQNKYTDKTVGFFNNSKNFRYVEEQKGFRVKGGGDYDIFIDRKLVTKDRLTFRFLHTDVVSVTVRNGKERLFESGKDKSGSISIDVRSLKTLKVGNKLVSHLGFETRTDKPDAFLWLEIE